MSTQNTIVGVLAGVAIGAIAGVLLAPEKGEKTRKQLATKAKALKDDLTDEVEVAANKVSEKYEDLKTASDELVAKSKVKLTKVKEELAS